MSVHISSEIWISAVVFSLSKPQFTFTIQTLESGQKDNSIFSGIKALCTQPPLAWSFCCSGNLSEQRTSKTVQPYTPSHTVTLIRLSSYLLGPGRHYSHLLLLQSYSNAKLELRQCLTTYSQHQPYLIAFLPQGCFPYILIQSNNFSLFTLIFIGWASKALSVPLNHRPSCSQTYLTFAYLPHSSSLSHYTISCFLISQT